MKHPGGQQEQTPASQGRHQPEPHPKDQHRLAPSPAGSIPEASFVTIDQTSTCGKHHAKHRPFAVNTSVVRKNTSIPSCC
ncbi:MAG: hypothetical protein R3B90_13010 [Planctomycetaceae bacterium]